MKVSWTEHKTNEEILQTVETEREIMDTVRSRQKRWLGHLQRNDSLLRITLEGQMQGKKAYERPRTMLLNWLLKTEEGNISHEELKMFAQDRSRWSQWRCKPAIWQNTAEITSTFIYHFYIIYYSNAKIFAYKQATWKNSIHSLGTNTSRTFTWIPRCQSLTPTFKYFYINRGTYVPASVCRGFLAKPRALRARGKAASCHG